MERPLGLKHMSALRSILDSCDVETFLVCENLDEGKSLGLQLMAELGFKDIDVVSCEFGGPGVRIRLRGYANRPTGLYPWLVSTTGGPK